MTVWNVMDVLEQAYALAGQLGLVHSKAEFSERMLGKGASYLSSMSARQRYPSKDVLLTLESKLLERNPISLHRIQRLQSSWRTLWA
ncbi:DUF6626 family protein [Pelagibacterium luteolum]|uniref:Uncharacterized protein n=1 Tax=Pelagibacterium luteolum TaxID=440168 RepID=A0A1G8AS15_9HYPH|nr:DUF6626 family protein [Pelagibacterium luteolum]SDH23653.1 hypothetical protein SAMN04487974_13811 [Pelagibacterium luteolum]